MSWLHDHIFKNQDFFYYLSTQILYSDDKYNILLGYYKDNYIKFVSAWFIFLYCKYLKFIE